MSLLSLWLILSSSASPPTPPLPPPPILLSLFLLSFIVFHFSSIKLIWKQEKKTHGDRQYNNSSTIVFRISIKISGNEYFLIWIKTTIL